MGEQKKLLELIQRKIRKGKSLPEIAEEVEESEEAIRELYELAQNHPDEEPRKLIKGMEKEPI